MNDTKYGFEYPLKSTFKLRNSVTIQHRDLARVAFFLWQNVPDRADEGISNNIFYNDAIECKP
jgi:hypothetical protein